MALFKINKGQKANLPTTYVEGYCYFTTDDGKFYIDTSNAAGGRILLNAGKADTLSTARTIRTDLGSTSTASFDGSKNVTPGVTGTLPIANGGTGATTAAAALTSLGAAAANHTHSYDSLGLYDGFFRSQRDFTNGALIQTSIDYSQSSGAPWSIEIKGNSYGSLYPFSFVYQGYIWDNTVINHGGIMNGVTITGISLFNYNGNLCFYIPRQVYWQGFAVYVANESSGIQTNKVTSITDVAKPTNITKEVALTNIRYNTYGLSCNLSGTTLTITDNK